MPEGRTDGIHRVVTKSAPARITSALAPPYHFFATSTLPCPYVEGQHERKLVVELFGRGAPDFYNALSRAGFRRSHSLAYRPACPACARCVPVRIPVADFIESRSRPVPSLPALSTLAPRRKRHGGDELRRLPR